MPSQRSPVILAALLLAVVLIAGSAGCISQPTVTVDDVRIGSLTPANTTLEVEIQITNPNSFDIPLKDIAFTISSVEAAGPRQLGAGATGPFTLAARQTVNKTVLVTLDNRALLEAALAAVSARQTSMTFRVEGTVSGSAFGILPVNVPFSYDRTVTLGQMLGMAGIQVGENEVRQVLGGVKTVVGGAIQEIAGRIGG